MNGVTTMAEFDEYSQLGEEDDFGGWGDEFSQVEPDYDNNVSTLDGSVGDYVVVVDEYSQVATGGRGQNTENPKKELERALKEIAKQSGRRKDQNVSSPVTATPTSKAAVRNVVDTKKPIEVPVSRQKEPSRAEEQLSLGLPDLNNKAAFEAFDDSDAGMISVHLSLLGTGETTHPELIANAENTQPAQNAEAPSDVVSESVIELVAASTELTQAPEVTLAVEVEQVVASTEVTQVSEVELAVEVEQVVASTEVTQVSEVELAVDAIPAVEVERLTDASPETPAVKPVVKRKRAKKDPDAGKRRYDKEGKRLRLQAIEDCVLANFAEKQFCLQDIKDRMKSQIEEWEREGVLGFDTELAVFVKGMGVQVVGQVQKMSGKRGRPSNIMVLVGR